MLYKRNVNIEFSSIGNEIGMLNIDTGMYYVIDEIGKDLWDYLVDPISVTDLVNKTLNDYDIDYETCLNDVKQFLQELHERKLIDVV